MTELQKRNVEIDLVKAIAIVGVVIIHLCSTLFAQPVASAPWNTGLFLSGLFRASVPLFLMASGAVMLNPQKELPLKKLYLHNIARIIVSMLVWGMAYKVFHLCLDNTFSGENLFYSIKRLFLFDQEFHFYYIHIILIVYVFLPLLRFFAHKADKKLIEYGLLLWFALGIVFPNLMPRWPFNLLGGLTGQWAINMTYAAIGYALLGYYVLNHPLSLIKSVIAAVAGFGVVFAGTYFSSLSIGALDESFLQGMSVGVCLLAVGVFSLCKHIKLSKSLTRLTLFVSKGSFLIYLSHMFVIYIMQVLGITAMTLPFVISVPVLCAVVVCICLGVYYILSKIPVVNKWII